ncbi:hypothetical protein [Mycobacterium yunnanensis]|nr:hypothetical protein [Mycobacterium yunnanensis]
MVTRWAIGALGVLAVAVAVGLPWYAAQAVGGSADMAGWGAWSTVGDVDAGLRPLPLGVLVLPSAGLMVYGAVRGAFGLAVVGAMATFAVAVLPFLVMRAVDRHVPGSGSVAVEVAAAPLALLGVGFVGTVVCWIGYARCVLRPSPRQDA